MLWEVSKLWGKEESLDLIMFFLGYCFVNCYIESFYLESKV